MSLGIYIFIYNDKTILYYKYIFIDDLKYQEKADEYRLHVNLILVVRTFFAHSSPLPNSGGITIYLLINKYINK